MWSSILALQLLWCISGVSGWGRTLPCSKETFLCKNGKCVRYGYVCDRLNDCGDRSDESVCDFRAGHSCEGLFRCGDGHCLTMERVCDGSYHCTDGSDEAVCGPDCPKFSHQCANKQGCYSNRQRCDWKYDCSDGSDERLCACMATHVACADGSCAQRRDMCCAMRDEVCVAAGSDDTRNVFDRTLIYTKGQELYALNLSNNSTRLLHRNSKSEITALTHRTDTNTLFWSSARKIWSLSLKTADDRVQLFGEIRAACLIVHMVYDWATGYFYLLCESARVIVCTSRSGDSVMLCSTLISFEMKQITWLDIDPHTGRMFIGGQDDTGFKIVAAGSDGSGARIIHHQLEKVQPEFRLDPRTNEILILKSDGDGSLHSFDLRRHVERRITVLGVTSTGKALFDDMAILQHSNTVFAVYFSQNRTVFRQRDLDIEPSSRLFHLIEPKAQVLDENPCNHLKCDDLCLLVHGGAVCKCASLFADDSSCKLGIEKKDNRSEVLDVEVPGTGHSVTEPDDSMCPGSNLLTGTHIGFIAIILVCGAVLAAYVLSKKKLSEAQISSERTGASANFVVEGSSMALKW